MIENFFKSGIRPDLECLAIQMCQNRNTHGRDDAMIREGLKAATICHNKNVPDVWDIVAFFLWYPDISVQPHAIGYVFSLLAQGNPIRITQGGFSLRTEFSIKMLDQDQNIIQIGVPK